MRSNLTTWFAACAGLLVAHSANAADLGKRRHAPHRPHASHGAHAHKGRIHYGGAPGLGYWRRGPLYGKGFAFSTYRGDPFGKSDYYDGDGCFYRRGRDFCVQDYAASGPNPFRRPRYVHPLAAPSH